MDAIAACDTQRLAVLLSGRKRPSWNDYHESEDEGSVSSPPFLHMAVFAERNALDMIKILVKAGMDINVLDKYGRTVLHQLLLRGNLSDISRAHRVLAGILDLGCDPWIQDMKGLTALHMLVMNETKEWLDPYFSTLLSFVDYSQRTSYVNATDAEGRSAIFYGSVQFPSASIVVRLLDLHADPFVGNPTGGSSILHRGLILCPYDDELYYDLPSSVIRLLKSGCGDPMARDERGRTALHLLVRNDPKYSLDDRRRGWKIGHLSCSLVVFFGKHHQ